MTVANDHLYRGKLAALLPLLTDEAARRPVGSWAWYRLPHGALVSVAKRPDGIRLLRIARQEPPKDMHADAAWERELRTFIKHFGGEERWRRTDETHAAPTIGVAAYFEEVPA